MATYSLEQFEKAYKNAADLYGWKVGEKGFSQADWNNALNDPDFGMSVLNGKLEYLNATTPEEKARINARVEANRAEKGYSEQKTGNSYYKLPASPDDFQMSEAKPSFSYDMESDPVYQAYQKQYAREGKRATQNALGAAASATGGIPSSYAVTAASQAGDYYASQMADKVPELYNQAYNRYLNDLAQWNTDRDFGYGQFMDERNWQKADRQEKFQTALTAAEYGDYSKLEDMGFNMDNVPNEWQKNFNLANLAASVGDYSFLNNLFGIKADGKTMNSNLLYNLAVASSANGDNTYLNQMLKEYFG